MAERHRRLGRRCRCYRRTNHQTAVFQMISLGMDMGKCPTQIDNVHRVVGYSLLTMVDVEVVVVIRSTSSH